MKINVINLFKKNIKKIIITVLIILVIFIIPNYYSKLRIAFIIITISIVTLYLVKKNNVIKMIIQSYKELGIINITNIINT
ncbi:MAG: hypothetical protein N4Q03_02500, partial [Candidatus Lightella neohaematopini]|nr:hypothetical protein [Candidatus Lightella neohaematopini]